MRAIGGIEKLEVLPGDTYLLGAMCFAFALRSLPIEGFNHRLRGLIKFLLAVAMLVNVLLLDMIGQVLEHGSLWVFQKCMKIIRCVFLGFLLLGDHRESLIDKSLILFCPIPCGMFNEDFPHIKEKKRFQFSSGC